jgi:hypothetical protein
LTVWTGSSPLLPGLRMFLLLVGLDMPNTVVRGEDGVVRARRRVGVGISQRMG